MSGRGEPRGGAGALGGATSHRGDTAEAGGTEGSGGRPRSRPEPRIPPPGCPQVQYRPIATGPKLGLGGAPGCPQPHFGLAARPLSPSGPVSLPTSHHGAMRSCAGPKGLTEAPPQLFLGVTVLRVLLGRGTASGFALSPPPNPSCRALIHCRRVWATFMCPFPENGGTTPKKTLYLQAWRGWGLRCSARVLGSNAGGCRAWGGFFPHPTLPPLCQAAAEEGLLHQGSVHPIFFLGGGTQALQLGKRRTGCFWGPPPPWVRDWIPAQRGGGCFSVSFGVVVI